ncbi:PLD nuclease N-terminal domain-containing protein [Arthrobacter sp. NPDC093139]|jgi:hypothetical protein|uniref:PLD nuclease N-terminal domain-containing protein n=1 Tax=Arthrobacter sp. NPDC093139 TaxID=3363945 RepID=UPI0037F2359A
MLRVAIAVAVLAIYVYGLVDVIRTDASLTRGFSKTTWILIVVLLPIVGAALWFLIGRPRYEAPIRRAYAHPTAPDDDPDFLRNLEQRRRKQAEAERLRKLKDDLEAKKAKNDDGSRGTGESGASGAGDASAEGNPEAK